MLPVSASAMVGVLERSSTPVGKWKRISASRSPHKLWSLGMSLSGTLGRAVYPSCILRLRHVCGAGCADVVSFGFAEVPMAAIVLIMNTEINSEMKKEVNSHLLKREIKYYSRRSMKEMDEFVAKFTIAKLDSLTPAELVQLRDLLLLPDEPIRNMMEGTLDVTEGYANILPKLRAFQMWP